MNSSDFFSILTMAILGLFSVVFLIVYLYDHNQRFAGWCSAAYTVALIAFLTDLKRTAFTPIAADFLSNGLMWLVGVCLFLAYHARLNSKPPLQSIGTLFVSAILVQSWFSYIHNDLILRSLSANLFGGFILIASLPLLWRHITNAINRAIFWFMALLSANYLIRPFLVYFIMDAQHTHETYVGSSAAMALHMTLAVFSLAGAVILLVAMGHDIIMRLHQKVVIDPLTRVMNRRGYEELLEDKMNGPQARQAGRAVMMIDVDSFKKINDHYGHQAGDEVLKRIAQAAYAIVEHHGILARVGGEEFAVILSQTSSALMHEIAEHLRLAFGLLVHPELPAGEMVTASFGLASTQQDETLKRALRRADIALYVAKDRGRNRVVDSADLVGDLPLENVA